MAVTQYIGSRYVPLFADPAEWSSAKAYEPLTVVLHEGNSYTSKQSVPVGIDIDNTEFWAETGNYNAQVEAYRREVLQYSDEVQDVVDAVDNLSNEVDEQIEEIKTTAHGSVVSGQYVGRINFRKLDNKKPQGCCVIDANTAIVTLSNSDTNNECNIYEIDIPSRTIQGTYVRQWGHANGIAYNKSNDSVYVAPCYDYVTNQQVYKLYKCNSRTYNIDREISFNFRPHAVAYDDITNKMYVLAFDMNAPSSFSVYEYNYSNDSTTLLFTKTYASIKNDIAAYGFGGYQELCARNGLLYYQISDSSCWYIIVMDLTGNIVGCINVDSKVGIYKFDEGEGMDFFPNGDLFYSGACNMFETRSILAMERLSLSGKSAGPDINQAEFSPIPVRVDATKAENFSLRMDGSYDYPYNDLVEAIYYNNRKTFNDEIIIVGSGAYYIDIPCTMRGTSLYATVDDVVINLSSQLTMKRVIVGSRTFTHKITFAKNIGGFMINAYNVIFRGVNFKVGASATDSFFGYLYNFCTIVQSEFINESSASNNPFNLSSTSPVFLASNTNIANPTGNPSGTLYGVS